MHRYETALLGTLKEGVWTEASDATARSGLGRESFLWAIENLYASGYIEVRKVDHETVELTQEGKEYAASEMPEESLLRRARNGRLGISEMRNPREQIGLQWARKKNLISIDRGAIELTKEGRSALEKGTEEGNALRLIAKSPDNYFELAKSDSQAIVNLVKRGLVAIRKKSEVAAITITEKGSRAFAEGAGSENKIDALSKEIIANESWKEKGFRPYDVSLKIEPEPVAMMHPVRKTINELERIYLSLGFTQVSGPIIEPAFWVFDSLFVPQDHPAREMQDTFYLSNPEKISISEEESVQRIKKAHLGSWGGSWAPEYAEQALLRTHTTNISVRQMNTTIRRLFAEGEKPELPVKLFSVGRVFRNENIDYRHLTDFYQHEGIVIGRDLTFANLFSILISIYDQLGMEIRFKPAYFPFVEPGVEFYAYSDKTKEWIEMGGAGMIRREITGMPRKNISVLAWGPGLERIMLLKDPSVKSIAELYNSDIGWLRRRKRV